MQHAYVVLVKDDLTHAVRVYPDTTFDGEYVEEPVRFADGTVITSEERERADLVDGVIAEDVCDVSGIEPDFGFPSNFLWPETMDAIARAARRLERSMWVPGNESEMVAIQRLNEIVADGTENGALIPEGEIVFVALARDLLVMNGQQVELEDWPAARAFINNILIRHGIQED